MVESGWARRRHEWELAIEKSAMELYTTDGVDAVTVRQIADAAGISERTFYRYFPSKEDILWARPRRVVSVLPKALTDRPEGEALLDAFRQAGRQVLSVFTDEPEAWTAWARVVQNTAPTTTQILAGDDNP
jgi:AcrR family transcriptional regulator